MKDWLELKPRFYDVLVSAFDNEELKQLLWDCNRDLDHYPQGTFPETVYFVIQDAERHGWLDCLVRAARDLRPRHKALQYVTAEILAGIETEGEAFYQGAVISGPAAAPIDAPAGVPLWLWYVGVTTILVTVALGLLSIMGIRGTADLPAIETREAEAMMTRLAASDPATPTPTATPDFGSVSYDVPKRMIRNEEVQVVLLISPSEDYDPNELATRVVDILIEAGQQPTDVVTASVKMARHMSASLSGVPSDAFEIVPLQQKDQQLILDDEITQWEWTVLPKVGGTHTLILRIERVLEIDNISEYLKEEVYRDNVIVEVPFADQVKDASAGLWDLRWFIGIIATVVIAPFVGYWLKRRDRESEGRNADKKETDGKKSIEVGDLNNVEGAAVGSEAMAAKTGDIGGSLIQSQGDVIFGKHLRDEHYEIAINWEVNNKPRMRGFELAGRNLAELGFENADLRDANLSQADLKNASLQGADLEGANLSGADMRGCNLTGAILSKAKYDAETKWPDGFDPEAAGAIFVGEKGNLG